MKLTILLSLLLEFATKTSNLTENYVPTEESSESEKNPTKI